VRVGQPEVNRHRGRLGEEADEQQHHRHDHQRVGRVAVERGTDLRHVERTGPRIEHPDRDEDRVRGDAVGDREVDRALDRSAFLDPVRGERVRHRPHQLEAHDQVEQVAGEAEPDHGGEEHQHQCVEQAVGALEVAPRIDDRGGHEHARQRGHPRADRVDRERDPDRHRMIGAPPAHPVGERSMDRADEQDRRDGHDAHPDSAGHQVVEQPRRPVPDRHGQGGRDHRHDDRERGDVHVRPAPPSAVA
jgi:hypothetical protein